MGLKVTKRFSRESDFSSGRYCISWASLPHIHPFVLCYFVRNVLCVRVSPADGWLWVVWGFVFDFFLYYDSSYHEAPCEGNNLSLSLTLSFACLIMVSSVSVSWSLDLVSLCNWVFCLCLVFESDTADACRSVRRGGTVAQWLVGPRVLRGEDWRSSPPALIFLFSPGTHQSHRSTRSSFLFPGISIKRSPTSSLTLTLSLSVSRWVQGLVSRSSSNPGKLPAFQQVIPRSPASSLSFLLSNQLLGNTHKKLNVYITRFSFDFIRNAH